MPISTANAPKGPAVKNGRIKQSIVDWCYTMCGDQWSFEELCQVAKDLGVPSVELCAVSNYPILKKYGLDCAISFIDMSPDAPFMKGFNNPVHWPRVIKATKDAIDAASENGFERVICFTGFTAAEPSDPNSPVVSRAEGIANCVEGFKQVVGHAEEKKVTLCLEHLNTRDDSHPMKGHPGYQGDDLTLCVEIIEKVGSPRLKLLFDLYHVQIMHGDLIRNLRKYIKHIGHVHVAGNPGRGELDNKQEINFPPTMQALLDLGYEGYVGQEFIPTRNAYEGLYEAVSLCDV